jgi:hypothetical protein
VTNRRVVLGVGQIVVAAAFLMSGGAKFASPPMVVAVFNAIGVGEWSAISPARWKSIERVASEPSAYCPA